MNDREIHVVARAVIMLLIALLQNDGLSTPRILVHIWHSARLPAEARVLLSSVRDEVRKVLDQSRSRAPDEIASKSWQKADCSFTVHLTLNQWRYLDRILANNLVLNQAERIRTRIMRNTDRKNSRELHYAHMPGPMRLCMDRFLESGVLLPFGNSYFSFLYPN